MFVLILALLFALFIAVFAVQNAVPVAIKFFWLIKEVPLVLVILGSVLAGAALVFLLALWREFRHRRKVLAEKKIQAEQKATEDLTPITNNDQPLNQDKE